jgi:transcriptional regulator
VYNPETFKVEDLNEFMEFMSYNIFTTLISISNTEPVVSHVPLVPILVGDQIELIGHIARQNPHAKILGLGDATVIFHGAHTYITPKWYAKNNVPTWNYSVLHARGRVELIEDYRGLVDCLKILVDHSERLWTSGWQFNIPDDLYEENLSRSILGFKMKITNINFKRKLSQNRSELDRKGIMRGLLQRADENSRKVLDDMNKIYK